jgi:hypothetical protein
LEEKKQEELRVTHLINQVVIDENVLKQERLRKEEKKTRKLAASNTKEANSDD